ncbi:MAG: glucose-1-phosphate cytidylyltransferase [Candidatus Xenobia bacterium]
MKVVILCGGQGMRIREETEFRPKPMIEIGHRPILWHIMKLYAAHGFREFILCLGYKGDFIKNWFINYPYMNSDFTVVLGQSARIEVESNPCEDWRVTLVDTGYDSMTGARVKRIQRYVQDDAFMLTYGDGLADVDVGKLLEFHRRHGRLATITGVRPPSRWGELVVDGDSRVQQFREKPQIQEGFINGGFMVLKREVFDYLSDDPACNFERGPMERLVEDGQMMVFPHDGFWQAMDTYRDLRLLNDMWESGAPPWRVWS